MISSTRPYSNRKEVIATMLKAFLQLFRKSYPVVQPVSSPKTAPVTIVVSYQDPAPAYAVPVKQVNGKLPFGICWSCEGTGRYRGYVCRKCGGNGKYNRPLTHQHEWQPQGHSAAA